jgi:hypothetical protein
VLTSFLLSLLQNVLITIMATRNVIAPLDKTIATANEVIVGRGKETEIGKETGTVAGERERTASATLIATGNAQTGVTAKGIVIGNAVAIAKRDAHVMKKNADETSHVKMTDVAHPAAATMREVPLAVPAAAEAANVMVVVLQNAAHQRP